jgi:hypothetical protein
MEGKRETDLVFAPVYLENRNTSISVYFIPRRMSRLAFHLSQYSISPRARTPVKITARATHLMSPAPKPTLDILQTKLTNPQPPIRYIRILLGKWSIVPRLNIVLPESDRPYAQRLRRSWCCCSCSPRGGWPRGSGCAYDGCGDVGDG